ncbi:MAG TPA: hypothetical protein VFJ82_08935 [Longimicrobium sp.]|nr:hypothetical protein [Longimicrobium sp.]
MSGCILAPHVLTGKDQGMDDAPRDVDRHPRGAGGESSRSMMMGGAHG